MGRGKRNLSLRCGFCKGFLVMQITWGPSKGNLKNGAAAVWDAILDFIYPPHCLLCRAPLEGRWVGFCAACWAGLEAIVGPRCLRCGCPIESEAATCRNCADKLFKFNRMRALSPFNFSVQRLIHMLKYQGRTSVGRVLGEALGEALKGDVLTAEAPLILPVPLHGSRRRERGYNQSALIARAAGTALGLSVQEGMLQRIRPTQTQTALDAEGRRANVAGAFRVKAPHRVQDRTILVIDDVVTTGATVNACAAALKAAGARKVYVAAVACPYFDEKPPDDGRPAGVEMR